MNNFTYYEPINRKIINTNGEDKLINEIGHIALMCPYCFYMVKIPVCTSRYIGKVLTEINDFSTDITYHGECAICKEIVKFETIDVNISDIITVLNTKGYYTAFCCEGHIEPDFYDGEESFSRPYIYFYFWDDIDILNTHPLPDTWRVAPISKEANNFVIEDVISEAGSFEEYEDYINWVKNNWINREERLLDIYNWACNLPHKDPDKKILLRKIIEESGNDILEANAKKYIEVHNSKTDNFIIDDYE